MSWMQSIGCGLVCAVAGGAAAVFIGNLCTTWYRIPDRNMASAFFLLYAVVLGAALGLAFGIAASRMAPAGDFRTGLVYGLGAVAATSVLAYAAARMGGEVPPTISGSRIYLQLELRAPAGWKLTNKMKSTPGWLRLASMTDSGKERYATDGNLEPGSARLEAGRLVIPGNVFVFTGKGRRVVQVRLGGEEVAAFDVPLPSSPGKSHLNWSVWLPAGSASFEYRYRVQRRDDLKREEEAAKAAREKFVRDLPENAPLEQYLATVQDQDWDTRNKVARMVSARAAELIPMLESGDRRKIEMALRAATGVNPLPASFEAPLLRVLRELLSDLRELHATEQTDPDKLEASALKGNFINWFTSWKNCHHDRKVVPVELNELLAEAGKFDRKQLEDAASIAVLGKQYLGEWSAAAPSQ